MNSFESWLTGAALHPARPALPRPAPPRAQVLALTACIAESSGLKRKDKAALLARVEADLKALSPLGG